MEASEVLRRIFDHDFKLKTDEDQNKWVQNIFAFFNFLCCWQPRFSLILSFYFYRKAKYLEPVNKWVASTLDNIVPYAFPIIDNRGGRIGPSSVKFDVGAHFGLFIIGSERLSVHSQSNFSSILCNVCVFQGQFSSYRLGTLKLFCWSLCFRIRHRSLLKTVIVSGRFLSEALTFQRAPYYLRDFVNEMNV